MCSTSNKTGLQPVSGLVEKVHYFGGWAEGAKSLCCQGFAGRQPYRTGKGFQMHKSLTKVKKMNIENIEDFAKLNEKPSLRIILKGDLQQARGKTSK